MSITYKNIGYSSKTFYGITFKPGDIREVPGYINASGMSRVDGVTSITSSTPVPKKRSYTKKAITAESKLPDSTSTTTEDDNKLEEELANG